MRIAKTRKQFIFLLTIILVIIWILLSRTSTVVQKAEARLSASLYVTFKYNDRNFKYQNTEYEPHFGEYFVSYKDKNGKSFSFTVIPKTFPIFVSYDPLDQPMSEQ